MDARLLEILVCPLCKGPLKRLPGRLAPDGSTLDAELLCNPDHLAFPVRDGIPVMLIDEARKVGVEPEPGTPPTTPANGGEPSPDPGTASGRDAD